MFAGESAGFWFSRASLCEGVNGSIYTNFDVHPCYYGIPGKLAFQLTVKPVLSAPPLIAQLLRDSFTEAFSAPNRALSN
jgi:hypothetical protein